MMVFVPRLHFIWLWMLVPRFSACRTAAGLCTSGHTELGGIHHSGAACRYAAIHRRSSASRLALLSRGPRFTGRSEELRHCYV